MAVCAQCAHADIVYGMDPNTYGLDELSHRLAEKLNYRILDCREMIVGLSEVIAECLLEQKSVFLKGLGTFSVHLLKDFKVKHPRTGITYTVNRLIPHFKYGPVLKGKFKKLEFKED